MGPKDYRTLRWAAKLGMKVFALTFLAKAARDRKVMNYAPVILYRTLGPHLPKGMETAAAVWALCQLHIMGNRKTAARAGFAGFPPFAANRLFQALLDTPSGVVFAEATLEDSWNAIPMAEHRINLHIPEMLAELQALDPQGPPLDPEYPFILAAGERRSETSNTAVRDTSWHHKGQYCTLRINPQDAADLGCQGGDLVRLTTRRATVTVPLEITDSVRSGHITLPNGQGLMYPNAEGQLQQHGIAPNELTDCQRRDALAGTPWHKYVPARLEKATA